MQIRNLILLMVCVAFTFAGACRVERIDSDFDAEVYMEVRASVEAVEKLLKRYPDYSYLLFAEDRKNPIRMQDGLPKCWVERGPSSQFTGQANPGEFYSFQVGLYATRKAIADIAVRYFDLRESGGKVICASEFRCFNLGGVDWLGRAFTKKVSVPHGDIQPLWFGVQIPKDAQGRYEGTLTIECEDCKPTKLKLSLEVCGAVLEDAGDSELWRHSRLRWLDSTIGLDDELTAPYTPLEICGNTVQCLGRKVTINDTGLPENIVSFFSPDVVGRIENVCREILSGPISFIIETDDGCTEWSGGKVSFLSKKAGAVEWQSISEDDLFLLDCRAVMEFDGHITYRIILKAQKPIQVKDIRLEIPFKADVAKYLMGMGHKGGYRPTGFCWKWDRRFHHDSVWIGDVGAGLQCKLKGPNYRRPLVNINYKYGPLNMPPAWDNNGKGGCILKEVDNEVLLKAYSGPRTVESGEELHFYFDLLISPLKAVDTTRHWNTRYYHIGDPVAFDEIVQNGANIIIMHHGGRTNPYINYPFCGESISKLTRFFAQAHEKDLKVKIYYTTRELSRYVGELWALRSLGDEVFARVKEGEEVPKGPWGDDPWLKKHLRNNFIPGYRQRSKINPDASILTASISRWDNYYLEGLKWLIDNVKIDGLYLDDVAYDRKVMQRVRKILDRNRPGSLIDLHSGNLFQPYAGLISCAGLYMELFAYIDSLWFGEGFDYDEAPDYWLIEVSGIPFGLMGEMLQDGGNPWRGMVYGMTARAPETKYPIDIWKVWDRFGIEDAEMIGYWAANCPIKTDHKDVLATVYRKKDETLVSVASWADEAVEVNLQIDFPCLGLDERKARLYVPEIPEFQEEAVYSLTDHITIEAGKGYLIIIEQTGPCDIL